MRVHVNPLWITPIFRVHIHFFYQRISGECEFSLSMKKINMNIKSKKKVNEDKKDNNCIYKSHLMGLTLDLPLHKYPSEFQEHINRILMLFFIS